MDSRGRQHEAIPHGRPPVESSPDAVSVVLIESAAGFCVGSDFFAKILPTLEMHKVHIENEKFDDAYILTCAFLVRIRQAKKANG
jgi:hypothetical protein